MKNKKDETGNEKKDTGDRKRFTVYIFSK